MSVLRKKVRHLIHQLYWQVEQMSDEDLQQVRNVVESLYYDLYVLRAIQEAQSNLTPGDSLTREAAIKFLELL
ncbi:hypothetical protein [Phormidium sp. CCY1219]|jgi:hypothetical protein|uniref:hypothetical protein n=1 Tax=Phormidium sp. CCY1219 TaxID=2886104 RepID=UPI002D1F930A|nr:hypothetical protein [Phormidium sp. CCY1219]MEB3827212.1 hypothetical protein [Phormidium sp. CCY1219]